MSSNHNNLMYVYGRLPSAESVPSSADESLTYTLRFCTSSSNSNHVAINVDDEKHFSGSPSAEMLLLAQTYEVPTFITQRLAADVQQANAAAVISALFAGALVTLATMVQTSDGSERLPQALRWFSYSSIFFAFASTFLCLTCVRMASDLPGMAARKILDDPNCLPARIVRGEPIPIELFRDTHELLRRFGGSRSYQAVDNAFNFIFMFGSLCTFTSLILFIWQFEDPVLAGPAMGTVVPSILCVIWSFRPSIGFRARLARSFT